MYITLAECNINILDISQTIVNGYFNMMMIVDTTNSCKSFDEFVSDLERVGMETGYL